jgi:hypothetical protein
MSLKMKKFGILFIFLFLSVQLYAQDSGIKVISSAHPTYPPTALAVGATGEVDVLATVSNDGDVLSAEVFTGHPLLRAVSKASTLQWKFEKNPTPDIPRSVVVAFYFGVDEQVKIIEKSEHKSEDVSEVTSPSTSRVEVRFTILIPKLLLLPRDKGKIKAEKCGLHDEWMEVEILPVKRASWETTVGTSAGQSGDEADTEAENNEETYYEASEKYFPHAEAEYYGGDLNEATEKVEVHYCKTCRLKRQQWLQEHNATQ